MRACLAIALMFLPLAAATQDVCSAVNQAKVRTYGFHPLALSKEQRTEKSRQMDAFWMLVRTGGKPGEACLRQLINNEKTDTYFLFDAAALLASIDKSGESDPSILDGLTRTELADVQPAAFIQLALELSHRGIDITPAAKTYLHAPKVTVYLPKHGAYELNRVRGATLLYGSCDPALVDRALIPELASTDSEIRNTAAMILGQNMTEASFKAVASLPPMNNLSKDARELISAVRAPHEVNVVKPAKYSREQMLEKLARLPDMDLNIDEAEDAALDNSIYATFTVADLDAVREGRRKMIVGVSNESVEGYEEMSRILLNLINVVGAYSQYRTH